MSEPPPSITTVLPFVGKTSIYGLPFFLNSSSALNGHIAIIGMSGSGKTFFTKNLIIRNVSLNISRIFIVDYNGEYSNLTSEWAGKCLSISRNYTINILNPIFVTDEHNKSLVVKFIKNMAKLSYDEVIVLEECITNFISVGNAQNSRDMATLISSISVEKYGELGKTLSAKLKPLKNNPLFIYAKKDVIYHIINGKFTNIDLSNLKINQRDIAMHFVFCMASHAMSSLPIGGNPARTFIVDEAWRALKENEDVVRLFREGRKYGIGVIAVSQLLSDIKDDELANVGRIIIFRLNNLRDVELIKELGIIKSSEVETVLSLPVGSCIIEERQKFEGRIQSHFRITKTCEVAHASLRMMIEGVQMEIPMSRFITVTSNMDFSQDLKVKLIEFASEKSRNLQLLEFITKLIQAKAPRSEIIYYLRKLGFSDRIIVKSYLLAEPSILSLR